MRKLDLQIDANNKEWLEEHYVTNKESMEFIAKLCKVSVDSIRTRLNRFSIPRMTLTESRTLSNLRFPRIPTVHQERKGKMITCRFCSGEFYKNQKSTRIYCSIECRNNYWKEHRKRDQDWRYYPEYKGWRDLVYLRDNWKCRLCSSKLKINAHHIKSGASFIDGRFDTSNGITLCEKHHIQVHSPLSKELLTNNPNIGGSPEVGNPEASLEEYLYSLTRSND
jgi:hypothetical protein